MTYRVKFVVKPGGRIETTVEGIKGPSCLEKTQWLEDLGKVEHIDDTPEACELEEEETEEVDYDW